MQSRVQRRKNARRLLQHPGNALRIAVHDQRARPDGVHRIAIQIRQNDHVKLQPLGLVHGHHLHGVGRAAHLHWHVTRML